MGQNFHIFLTASGEGEGGSTQAVSLTVFFPFFFLITSLSTLQNLVIYFREGFAPLFRMAGVSSQLSTAGFCEFSSFLNES